MENKGAFTKILAIAGTVLVWFPILVPILFSAVSFFADRRFRFDYLMPAELFPSTLAGGALLLWAALRARTQRKLIGWGLGAAVVLLFGGQGLAIFTGLASGESEPTGWKMAIVLGTIIGYALALVAIGVGGIMLLRELFKQSREAGV